MKVSAKLEYVGVMVAALCISDQLLAGSDVVGDS